MALLQHGAQQPNNWRFVGDDAVYAERPGRTSPPFPGHDMKPGQRLREDWFPVVFSGS